eukprot:7388109-Prymnesium_polylepis.4
MQACGSSASNGVGHEATSRSPRCTRLANSMVGHSGGVTSITRQAVLLDVRRARLVPVPVMQNEDASLPIRWHCATHVATPAAVKPHMGATEPSSARTVQLMSTSESSSATPPIMEILNFVECVTRSVPAA